MEDQHNMNRRGAGRVTVIIGFLILLIAIAGIYWWWSKPTFDLVRLPRSDDYRAWPMERFWQWKVRLPEPKPDEVIQLQLLTQTEPAPKGTSVPPINSGRKLLTPKTSEIYADAGDYRLMPDQSHAREATIAFQVIDYPPGRQTLGMSTTRPTANRSVLGSIDYGGVTSFMTRTELLPLEGSLEGWHTETDQNWTKPSLLVARFWMKQGDQRRIYELVLVRHDLKRWPLTGERDE